MLDATLVTADQLLALPLEAALSASDERECFAYSRVFLERAKQCDDGGDAESAKAWALLLQLSQLRLRSDDESQPFLPMVPCQFRGGQSEAIHKLALQVKDSELRARLLDVVWESNRDHAAADAAIDAYLESAKRLLDPERWVAYATRCERALRLAVMLRREELRAAVASEIEQTVATLDGEDTLFLTIRLVALLLEFRHGDLAVLSTVSEKAASLAEESLAFDRACYHLENLAICRRRLGDIEGERSARGRVAGCFEKEGTLHLETGEPMVAAHWLEKAYVSYREIPGMREKAGDVYMLLRRTQRDAADAMEPMDLGSMDVTELVEEARKHVSGYGFLEALWRLLNIVPTTDFEEAERATGESLEGAVWWRVASRVTSDIDGRIVSRGSAPRLDGSDVGWSVPWEHVAQTAAMQQKRLGIAVIQPAMGQIMLEHAPSFHDVLGVVVGSPLVPFGHEGLFVKGLLDGLKGDLVSGLSVLVPQFENGLRHLLGGSGVEASSMDKMGYQDVYQLGRILSLPELEEILGSDLVKDMKVLFTDRDGPKERDRMSHGLMSSAEFYGGSAFYAWWLINRVCFSPSLSRHLQRANDADIPVEASCPNAMCR